MIEGRKAIVLNSHDRIALMDSTVNNVLFALGDTGRDEDDACSGSSETAGFLDFKERGITST